MGGAYLGLWYIDLRELRSLPFGNLATHVFECLPQLLFFSLQYVLSNLLSLTNLQNVYLWVYEDKTW
jgi:hypothetical protein